LNLKAKGEGTASLKIAVTPNSPFQKIARFAVLTISAPDMNTMTNNLTLTDTSVEGTVTGIPAGANRLFDIFVNDSLDKLQYRGFALSNVVADSTVYVFITIHRVTGNAVINGTIQESGSTNIESGLVAYWSFDSSYNNTYFDVTGHGYNATSTGLGLGLAQGVKGKALACSGGNYELTVKNSSIDFNLQNFSIECWYYSNIDPRTMSDLGMHILDYQYPAPGIRNGYGVYINPDGNVEFTMSSTDGWSWYETISNTIVQAQKWYHIVATYNGFESRVYINGTLESTLSHPGGYAAPGLDARIGCQRLQDGTIRTFVNGRIDELKLYDHALASDTVLAHYNSVDSVF